MRHLGVHSLVQICLQLVLLVDDWFCISQVIPAHGSALRGLFITYLFHGFHNDILVDPPGDVVNFQLPDSLAIVMLTPTPKLLYAIQMWSVRNIEDERNSVSITGFPDYDRSMDASVVKEYRHKLKWVSCTEKFQYADDVNCLVSPEIWRLCSDFHMDNS